jgi:predicted aspartyl protease
VVSLTSSSGGYINGRNSANLELLIDNAVSIMAPISVEGLVVKAVIDTGAEVTVISTSLFEKIPEGK